MATSGGKKRAPSRGREAERGAVSVTVEELRAFLAAEFPQCTATVEAAAYGTARLRQAIAFEHLRPGGTVSGPTMMATADASAYIALLTAIGIVPLAVTTSLSMSFMRKPRSDRAIVCDAELLKIGRTLAVADVRVRSEGDDALVAQATITYAIPKSA